MCVCVPLCAAGGVRFHAAGRLLQQPRPRAHPRGRACADFVRGASEGACLSLSTRGQTPPPASWNILENFDWAADILFPLKLQEHRGRSGGRVHLPGVWK